MSCQPENEVAGVDATRYVEEVLQLPIIGISGRILERSKTAFYSAAKRVGKPPVLGVEKFPKIVRPARGCVANLSLAIPGRVIPNGHKALISNGLAYNHDPEPQNDIIVQEYVEGSDYCCVVVEMGNTRVALPPMIWRYAEAAKEQSLSRDVKWHPATHEEVFPRSSNPNLFDRIRQAAEAAFYTNEMSGCS
ncbi:hypothetical protein V502_11517 [Pseudogymnoascus sp. VKM F-4520 (FW-2644)]|nr:hypothetical protein V502_11517 [Pseudogymnoascus sp. VKM F-4520 (FW-2644)]